MNGLAPSGGRLPEIGKKVFTSIAGLSFLTAAALVGGAVLYVAGKELGVRLAFDTWDMDVYFASARWVVEGGRLYREVPSEYPLFANIIFATVRYVSNLIRPGTHGFYSIWIATAWFMYLYAVCRVATGSTMFAVLAWLAPAPIYFALFRFDIYPAAATLMSLFAIRRTAYITGAIWLGVAVALKGYALFLLPAYCVFVFYQRGFGAAIKVGAITVTPIILSLLATYTFAGWEGMIAPFELHALRNLNGESTYDAINYLFGGPVISDAPEDRRLAQILQVGCAVAAAGMRPRKFEDLIHAFLFAVLGFMSFSVFYSPQFLLWILPVASFSNSPVMVTSSILFSWLTYFYFPISFGLMQQGRPDLFKAAVVAVSLLRLFMMFVAVKVRFGAKALEGAH